MDQRLVPGDEDVVEEVIAMLEERINDDGEPSDYFGEPPMTMNEMHTAAWKEHQEMHR
jgi:hypothetical protein